ncbi:MAG: histidine kinase N-terminal 7TM domain-containing protein [Halobacteriales archaeon]
MATEGLYIAGVLAASALGIVVVAWLSSDDTPPSTRLFVAMVALHSLVGLLVVAQLLAPDPIVIPVYGIQKAAAAGIMPLWFLFALTFTRYQEGLSRRAIGVISGYYVLLAGFELTNPLHRLLWSSYEPVGTAIPHLVGTTTLLYSVVTLPLAVFYFAGLGLFGVEALSGPPVSRRQSSYLFLGYVPPFFVLTAGIYEVLPGPVDGALVIVSTLSLAVVGMAVFRHRLFDLLPVARETVFEAVEDAVIVVDNDRRLLDVNDAATDAFPHLEGSEGADLETQLPVLLRENGDGDPFAESFAYQDDDGVRHYQVTVSSLELGGVTRGYGLVVRDVTENRKHVRDLEQQTHRLEQFARTLSHDIRNPLSVAEGRLRNVRDTGDLDQLEDVSQAHDRIAQIIDDVLELARTGRQLENPRRVQVAAVFRDAWDTTETGGATFVIEDVEELVVAADPDRLQRAFENLIRNTIEHGAPEAATSGDGAATGRSDGDGGQVSVTLGRHADGFYIEDNGSGVPKANREQVFEYEFTTAADGTGFGLALVEEIARAHGWSVAMSEGSQGGARVVFGGVQAIEPEPAG